MDAASNNGDMSLTLGRHRPLSSTGPATVVLLDPVEYVAELLSFGEVAQFRGQVLLKGLLALFGLALKGSMDFLGKVTDQYIRHACIMLTPIGGIKRQRRPSHEWIPCGTIHV